QALPVTNLAAGFALIEGLFDFGCDAIFRIPAGRHCWGVADPVPGDRYMFFQGLLGFHGLPAPLARVWPRFAFLVIVLYMAPSNSSFRRYVQGERSSEGLIILSISIGTLT